MTVPAVPRARLAVIEAEIILGSLKALLDGPAQTGRAGEFGKGGAGGCEDEIIGPLASVSPAAADQDPALPSGVIPDPRDQLGLWVLGHQWKLVWPSKRLGEASRVRHRSAMTASRSAMVSKYLLAMGSSSTGQRHSAGCSCGL